MATKLELQQINARLAADNQFLREKLSDLQAQIDTLIRREFELGRKLEEADQRCRKLIASRNHGNAERRAAMEAARQEAMRTGKIARVSKEGGNAGQEHN